MGFLYNLRERDEATTDTELSAIAADPIQGCSLKPSGEKRPAATGMPTKLYIEAKAKFSRIWLTVRRDRSRHPITSSKSF